MDRRTFLLGFLGSLATAPTIVATASSVEAASVPETLPPVSQPDAEPVSSGEAEVDLEKVEADWSRYGYRRTFNYPHLGSGIASFAPRAMSVSRERPRQMTVFPGGGSRVRAR